jgi:hypothetical protein
MGAGHGSRRGAGNGGGQWLLVPTEEHPELLLQRFFLGCHCGNFLLEHGNRLVQCFPGGFFLG